MALRPLRSWPPRWKSRAIVAGSLLLLGGLVLSANRPLPGSAAETPPAGKVPPPIFECRWADSPMIIDGKADEEAWKHAQVIDHFYLPWLGDKARPARTATKARLLWDREYLYF